MEIGSYFNNLEVEKSMTRIMEEYLKAEEEVLIKVLSPLVGRIPVFDDLERLQLGKYFKLGDMNNYSLRATIAGTVTDLGTIQRIMDLEAGVYRVQFTPTEEYNRLVELDGDIYDTDGNGGIINRNLEGVCIGEEIYNDELGFKYHGFFYEWIDNVNIRVSVNGVVKEFPAKNWKRMNIE